METEAGIRMLERVRGICRLLPEVEEIVDGFGHSVMKVNGKTFVMMGEGAAPTLSFKSDPETQVILIQQERYRKTSHIGRHGWTTIEDPQESDWPELDELIREAYLRAAPKRLVK